MVCLYVNDPVYYDKKIQAGQVNNIYLTDKGVLFKENNQYSKDEIQVFSTPQEAYDALLSEYTTTYISPPFLKWVIERSVFLAQVYEWTDLPLHQEFGTILPKVDHSKQYTQQIKDIAAVNGAKVIFTIIPHQRDLDQDRNVAFFQQMVEDTVYFPEGIRSAHYQKMPRIHFNNAGHQFYAEFLDRLLKEQLANCQEPTPVRHDTHRQ